MREGGRSAGHVRRTQAYYSTMWHCRLGGGWGWVGGRRCWVNAWQSVLRRDLSPRAPLFLPVPLLTAPISACQSLPPPPLSPALRKAESRSRLGPFAVEWAAGTSTQPACCWSRKSQRVLPLRFSLSLSFFSLAVIPPLALTHTLSLAHALSLFLNFSLAHTHFLAHTHASSLSHAFSQTHHVAAHIHADTCKQTHFVFLKHFL